MLVLVLWDPLIESAIIVLYASRRRRSSFFLPPANIPQLVGFLASLLPGRKEIGVSQAPLPPCPLLLPLSSTTPPSPPPHQPGGHREPCIQCLNSGNGDSGRHPRGGKRGQCCSAWGQRQRDGWMRRQGSGGTFAAHRFRRGRQPAGAADAPSGTLASWPVGTQAPQTTQANQAAKHLDCEGFCDMSHGPTEELGARGPSLWG